MSTMGHHGQQVVIFLLLEWRVLVAGLLMMDFRPEDLTLPPILTNTMEHRGAHGTP